MHRTWKVPVLLVSLLLSVSVASGWADCQSDYNEAMGLIQESKQTALDGRKLDSDAFMRRFQPVMDRMTQGGCMNEITQILQYVQREQTRYPAPAGQ